MDDRWPVSKPKEGFHTLVAEFSILHFDRAVTAASELRAQGIDEKQILRSLESRYKDFDESSRKKAYQLSLGITPKDDILDENVIERREHNPTTVELELDDVADRIQPGTVVYFERQRSVVTSKTGSRIILKRF